MCRSACVLRVLAGLSCVALSLLGGSRVVLAEDPPRASFMLEKFSPLQAGVDYERPKASDVSQCSVAVDRGRKHTGWKVIGSSGQVLRRFLDTNGNSLVDEWRYFKNGVEVYRDIDSNHNGKVDQSRWLNTGGSRWGIDTNEDGRIDS